MLEPGEMNGSHGMHPSCHDPPVKVSRPSIIEMTDSTKSETKKYFAIVDLVNIFCEVPI